MEGALTDPSPAAVPHLETATITGRPGDAEHAAGSAPLRWIPPLRLSGAWQMAIDTWLLDRAAQQGPESCSLNAPVLRFYSWASPTLSLGFHQRRLEPHWLELARRGSLQLVRRPSGGRAVLHSPNDLTYALVWPQAPGRRRKAYRLACGWLQEGFAALGHPLDFGSNPADPLHPSCFASSTAADLVHPDGSKRIGSAQLWRRGTLLQHGSILLAPDQGLWRQLLGDEPPALAPLPCDATQLIANLRRAAASHLSIAAATWREAPLSPAEWSSISSRCGHHRIDPDSPTLPGRCGPQDSPAGSQELVCRC